MGSCRAGSANSSGDPATSVVPHCRPASLGRPGPGLRGRWLRVRTGRRRLPETWPGFPPPTVTSSGSRHVVRRRPCPGGPTAWHHAGCCPSTAPTAVTGFHPGTCCPPIELIIGGSAPDYSRPQEPPVRLFPIQRISDVLGVNDIGDDSFRVHDRVHRRAGRSWNSWYLVLSSYAPMTGRFI